MLSDADAIRFNIQYKELGKKDSIPHLTPMNQVDGVVLREAGEASAGIIFAEAFGDMQSPQWKAFWALYSKKYKTNQVSNFAAHGYVGAMFVVKALQEIKGNIEDKGAFMKELKKTKIDSPIGPKSLDSYQNAVHDVIIMQIKKVDNKFEYVLLKKVPQAEQFGGMGPEKWMKTTPDWAQMRGKWIDYKPTD
jgi:branched-chain amino acid transport system substrate-binding protein